MNRREELTRLYDRCQDALSTNLSPSARQRIMKTADAVSKSLIGGGYKVETTGLSMADLARKAAYDLGLQEVPNVYYIRPCEDGEQPDLPSTPVWGKCVNSDTGKISVYVNSGLGHRDTVETFGHEMFHAKEFEDGRDADEAAACEYGRRFATWIIDGLYT